jgi:hypothetical protein
MRAVAITVGLVLALVACGSDDPGPIIAGLDAAIDTLADRSNDRDAGGDEGLAPDTGRDSLPEADVAAEAREPDTGVEMDASPNDRVTETGIDTSETESVASDAPDVSQNPDMSLDAPGEADAGDGAPEPSPGRKVGSSCATVADCDGSEASCIGGFCTQPCGAGTSVIDCNDPKIADRAGPNGGIYTCWSLGADYKPLCWPNGSGTPCVDGGPCPRPDESCFRGRCQYVVESGAPRTDAKCHRDGDCRQGESCGAMGNLDPTGYRGDGGCFWNGNAPNVRKSAGEPCTFDTECRGLWCADGRCVGLCTTDDDCSNGYKCIDRGTRASQFDEAASVFYGLCYPWVGSRAACAGNAGCPSGEHCAPYVKVSSNELLLEVGGACEAFAHPTGAAVGGSCSRDDECQVGRCVLNGVTGIGYCFAACLGGNADCGNGTSCRLLTMGILDPAMPDNDVREPFCVQTGVGAPCFSQPGCRTCVDDNDCNPDQGVYCRWDNRSAPTGFCRDYFGRCADPCRMDCEFGEPCPAASTCISITAGSAFTSYCRDNTTGACIRADFTRALTYLDGMCGDEQYPLAGGRTIVQKDLCYYYGSPGGQATFLCGQDCSTGVSCSSIAPSRDGSIPTTCRTVYEYGEVGPDGAVSAGGPRAPSQCAPADAFVGR